MSLRLLALLLLLMGLTQAKDLQEALEEKDQLVLGRLSQRFPVDHRYDDVLNRITLKVLPHVDAVFGREHPQPQLVVFFSRVGFNAVAMHRLVLVDTLLLDGLTRLCQGVEVYGTMQNGYTEHLAHFIAGVHSSGQAGLQAGRQFDPSNPYQIPPPPGLTPQLASRAEDLFEETLACWLCHELSHVYLGHAQEKLLASMQLRKELKTQVPATELDQAVQFMVDYQLGPARELLADRMGARLALASGYSVEGFRRCFLFLNRLEAYLDPGVELPVLRAHPEPPIRWKAVEELAGERAGFSR